MDNRETHILIIWPKALSHYSQILNEISSFFEIKEISEIKVNKKLLEKFYARSLASYSKQQTNQILKTKQSNTGRGKAKVLKLSTKHTDYDHKLTTQGILYKNAICVDKKQKLRELINSDFHLSDSLTDSKENQYHLNLTKDIHNNSVVDFFKFMNEKKIPYISMRGHEYIKKDIKKLIKKEKDIDLLVHKDYFNEVIKYPFLTKICDEKEERYTLSFKRGDEYNICKIDIYKTGLGVFPPDFENILLSNYKFDNSIKVPLDIKSLNLYHTVFHKRILPNKKEKVLELLNKNNLNRVSKNPYYPNWNSLPSPDRQLIKGGLLTEISGKQYFSYVFENDDGQIIKEGDLENIENEYSILKTLSKDLKDIVPSPVNIGGSSNMGILTMSKIKGFPFREMPNTYWNFKTFKKHLNSGLETLKIFRKHKIQHRDINPSNLFYTKDHIKFIDFGWSISKDSKIETPEGLNSGFYKDPNGHNDIYSLIRCFQTKYIFPPILKKILKSYDLNLIQKNLNSFNIFEKIIIDLFLRNQKILSVILRIKTKLYDK